MSETEKKILGTWTKGAATLVVISFHSKADVWKIRWGGMSEELVPTQKLVWYLDGAARKDPDAR